MSVLFLHGSTCAASYPSPTCHPERSRELARASPHLPSSSFSVICAGLLARRAVLLGTAPCGPGHTCLSETRHSMSDLEYDGEPEQLEQHDEHDQQQKHPRVRSTVAAVGKKKGRGFREGRDGAEEEGGNARYESLEPTGGAGPARSVEGYVLFVTGLHEEAQEEDVAEAFADFGDVKNVYLNLDRQTGYVKGYALIEYATEQEARDAIKALDASKLLDQEIKVTWAFVKGPHKVRRGRH